MSLINTNYDYLRTMGIGEESPVVGIIVSVYYLGCAVGAVLFSWFSDQKGRKPGIFACLASTALGNFLMFISGLGFHMGAIVFMFLGRIILGLGVGGIDAMVILTRTLHSPTPIPSPPLSPFPFSATPRLPPLTPTLDSSLLLRA